MFVFQAPGSRRTTARRISGSMTHCSSGLARGLWCEFAVVNTFIVQVRIVCKLEHTIVPAVEVEFRDTVGRVLYPMHRQKCIQQILTNQINVFWGST
jgi:hypothetical protein